VNFETGSARLTADSRATLDSVAESLAANPDVRIEIGGHTDNRGRAEMNRKLSLDRATSVRDYLLQKGVAGSRLEVKGYGPDQPIATNDTAEGRLQNRRVELRRIP
jgi:outer membrane protein OmpA-like peptidoglycan-associated protein